MTTNKPTLRASDVSRQLGDAGLQAAVPADKPNLWVEEPERGYRVRQHGPNTVHVRFVGRLQAQADALGLYRIALENLGYHVTKMSDPTSPEGWELLEVSQ